MLAATAPTVIPATVAAFDTGAGAWSLAPVAETTERMRVARSWLVAESASRDAAEVVWLSAGPVAVLAEQEARIEARGGVAIAA
jgi:hypothetical protein